MKTSFIIYCILHFYIISQVLYYYNQLTKLCGFVSQGSFQTFKNAGGNVFIARTFVRNSEEGGNQLKSTQNT